jgi:hypothetical protein
MWLDQRLNVFPYYDHYLRACEKASRPLRRERSAMFSIVALLVPLLATLCETSGAIAQIDLEPPSILISRPTRGEYLSSSEVVVEGRVSDAGSGVARLLVNGTTVTPDPVTGGFSANVPLNFGVNLLIVKALDRAGNAAHFSASVMYSPEYLPAGERIPNAAATRLTELALTTIGERSAPRLGHWIDSKLSGQTVFREEIRRLGICVASATVRAESVTYNPPRLVVDTVPTGLQIRLHVPNFRIAASARSHCGIPYSTSGEVSAQDAVVDISLALSIDPFQAFDVSATSSVASLQGFGFNINGIPGVIENSVRSGVQREVESRLADAVRALLPSVIRQTLSRLSEPISREMNGRTVTLALIPTSLTFDDGGFTVAFDGSVTAATDPTMPTVPGSVFRPSAGLPSYPNTAGFFTSINENVINGALSGSWHAGFWNVTVDQAFLQQLGVSLPFQLDASLLAAFFPALRPGIPAGGPVPMALRLEPKMQPVVQVSDGPGLLRLGLGELHVAVMLDLGAGFVPFLMLATHFEGSIDPLFAGDAFSFTVRLPERLAADVIEAPATIDREDLDRFIQSVLTSVVQVATVAIGPMPVPSLQGFTLSNLRVYPDGQAKEFVTIEGDVH